MAMTNEQKKGLARDLYLSGNYTFEEIAEKMGCVRQTVSKWAQAGNWKDLKASMTIGRSQILKNLYMQINEINENINRRDKGARFATSKEADVLAKLSAAVRKMETDTGISILVDAGMAFLDWLRTTDVAKAKEFAELWDIFIKDKIS